MGIITRTFPSIGSSDSDSGDGDTTTTTDDDDSSYADNYLGGNLTDEQRAARSEGAFLPEALQDLQKWADELVKIAKNPKGFVIGTILSVVIGYVLELWNLVIDAVRLVLFGKAPGYSPGDLMGLEDVVWVLWNIVSSPFGAVGGSILGTIEGFRTTIEALATQLGIAAFPATVAFVIFLLVVATRVATKISRAGLASVPIIGPALEVLLYE